MKALEERASLGRKLALRARKDKIASLVQRYEQQTRDAEHRATIIRTALLQEPAPIPVGSSWPATTTAAPR